MKYFLILFFLFLIYGCEQETKGHTMNISQKERTYETCRPMPRYIRENKPMNQEEKDRLFNELVGTEETKEKK